MTPNQNDTVRATKAAKTIVDNRDREHVDAILVTLEHTIATVLLAVYGDPRVAAAMMTEGLVPGVIERLSNYAAGRPQ